ncbi:hypothetical protein HU200_017859 [Digitaria exilis]|uniref:Uncharacterized protein n=1 Tax=Digitaria exilis TaxID=1010633 RepID=A0A835KG98_9POAL|nr:hypothetical protein HU200_017859 [Digitaria exilis]
MQPVSRLALPPARVGAPCQQAPRTTTTTPSRGCAWCVSPAPRRRLRARASCGGGGATEPVEAAREGVVPAVDQDQDREEEEEEGGLAVEELEVLEEAAIAGVDEGRRPTDYDRRAHIFEESSRVFRDLKHQRDGDAGVAGAAAAATAAETATRGQQQH